MNRAVPDTPKVGVMQAQRWTDVIAYHGEGPVWFPNLQRLRMVDMLHGAVLTVTDEAVVRTPVDSPVASVIRPRTGGGAVVATESGIAVAERDDLADLTPVVSLFTDKRLRTNEGGCDPQGRFYVGTMAYDRTRAAAAVYRWDGVDHPQIVLSGVTISNGLEWSPEGSLAYYNDTPTLTVWQFDHDLRNRRPWVQFDPETGRPDGLCVDSEGGVWVALNQGSAVHRYAPDGTLSEVIDVPVRQVTACTFGGTDLSELFITTSRENLDPDDEPAAGSVFVVAPGVRGMPPRPFRSVSDHSQE